MPSVLFVCTANICRSPMAAALFKARLKDKPGWRVESAGTWAPEGEPAAARAQLALRGRGLDLGKHRSRTVTPELLEQFDLILTMERGHKEALVAEFPEIASRVYLLSEMLGSWFDVRDPMGGTQAEFEHTLRELDEILAQGQAKIEQLARREES